MRGTPNAGPEMRISGGLQPGQVLQRRPGGARATVSGSCGEAGVVTATVTQRGRALRGWRAVPVGRSRAGRFRATLSGLPTGGPFAIVLRCARARVAVPEVFVGDLWLMAGQSNMEGCGFIAGAEPPHPLVRCLTMARRWEQARDPLHLKPESPDAAHGGQGLDAAAAERLRRRTLKGAGIGIPFARRMLEATGVPQGLIATAHGGTSMAQWDPRRRNAGGASLYGSMLLSLRAAAQPLAGVLWAQGESEALPELARVYTRRMRTLVAAVRRDLRQPDLPWLMLQAGRFIDSRAVPDGAWPDPAAWNRVQEQQRLLPARIARLEVVPTIDLGLDDLAHLDAAAFSIAADRLARCASRVVHGRRDGTRTIQPRTVRHLPAKPGEGPRIAIGFSHVSGALRSAGAVRGFTLIDADGRPRQAIHRVTLAGRRVVLHLVPLPLAGLSLRYGHGLDPLCTLVDDRGMAVPAFGPLAIA